MQDNRTPKRSVFLAQMISRALRHRVRSSFARVSWSGSPPEAKPGQGILFYSNHPSWWDPAVFALLQHQFYPDRAGYGPIDAKAVSRYPFLARAGFLPVDPKSPRSVRVILRFARCVLTSGNIFWLTAQGRFADGRLRPLGLKRGVAHFALSVPGTQIIPVALDYSFRAESRPEIAIRFGNPIALPVTTGTGAALALLETALTETMDQLTADIILGQQSTHITLLECQAGTGGLYGYVQHIAAWLRFKKYDPRHAPPS